VRRPRKFHAFLALAILFFLFAGLITYLHLSTSAKPLASARQQDATVMPLLPIQTNPAKVREQDRLRIEAGYGNLPLSFEPNRGQTDPKVKFLSRAGNQTLWLTADEAVLAVGRTPRVGPPDERQAAGANGQTVPAVLRMKFAGANHNARVSGEDRQAGVVNYFAGRPDQWRTNIHTYSRIRYHDLYPGIDLIFHGNKQELEYDLVVSRGADPGQIKLAIAGADEIKIDAQGNLVLKTSQGEVVQQKPKVYQRKGTTLKAVSAEYVISSKDEVGFRLGSYDRRAAVVIDPVLRYSTFLGGSGLDFGTAIAVDSRNQAVVAGQACSPNFPATNGNTPPAPGGCAAFVTKLDFTGAHVVFSTFLAGSTSNAGLALDPHDNIYLTGTTVPHPTNFPTTPGAFQTTPKGVTDAYVTKLNSSGTALVYSTLLGGSNFENGFAIAVDNSGNAYVTGHTGSADFPTTPGAFQSECTLSGNGCDTAYVTKLNATGSRALYSTFLGGHGEQLGLGIAVNQDGNAFVTGATRAGDFPTTAGVAQPFLGGDADAFVAEVSSSGSHLIYSTYLGGSGAENARAIALDRSGNAFITGQTASTDFPLKSPFQMFQRHCPDDGTGCVTNVFVTKLSPNGRLVYSTYLDGGVLATGIAVTPDGQAVVAGFTQSAQFVTTQSAFQRVFAGGDFFAGNDDIFLTKFSPTGKLVFSSYLGGNGSDVNPAVALDRDTNAYVTGAVDFLRPNAVSTFPVTPGAFQQKPGGGGDAFVAKVVALCALSTVNRSVTICSPASGSAVASPVRIIAGTTDVTPVKLTQVYLDGKKIYETALSAINVGLPIPAGTHRLTVQALDTASVFFKKSISINVSPH